MIRLYNGIMPPLAFFVFHGKHMVRKYLTEAKFRFIRWFNFSFFSGAFFILMSIHASFSRLLPRSFVIRKSVWHHIFILT